MEPGRARLIPVAIWYWIASVAASGTVAGLAHFGTLDSSPGFWDAFVFYTFPVPMAVGFVHIPSLIVGTFVCASFYRPKVGRVVTRVLGVALVGALVYHVAAQLTGHEEHWTYLAMVTVDIAILFAIGLLMTRAPRVARERGPDGRGAQRHW